jgi:hypothetical protein
MVRIECQLQLVVKGADGREASLSDLVPLLALVDESGSIAQAAQLKGLSYRHAWGLLRSTAWPSSDSTEPRPRSLAISGPPSRSSMLRSKPHACR